jgi:hypothetical protein
VLRPRPYGRSAEEAAAFTYGGRVTRGHMPRTSSGRARSSSDKPATDTASGDATNTRANLGTDPGRAQAVLNTLEETGTAPVPHPDRRVRRPAHESRGDSPVSSFSTSPGLCAIPLQLDSALPSSFPPRLDRSGDRGKRDLHLDARSRTAAVRSPGFLSIWSHVSDL